MAHVYILYSKKADRFYIGSCLSLEERLSQHATKYFENAYTTIADDWELFFNLDDLEFSVARKIEEHIKKMKSRTYIKNLNIYPEIGRNLIQKYMGSSR